MKRLTAPILATMVMAMMVTAFSAWGAEHRRPPAPLMPPEFPQSPFGFSKGDQKRGETIYQQNGCASCHMIEGKGGKVGPDLSRVGETKRLPDSYRQQLANNHRPPVTLIERDMDDLIAYLQNLRWLR